MHQRDYILRMIEQAGEAIRALRDRILGRKVDRQALRDELGTLLTGQGMDLELVRAADGDTLFMMVAPTGEVDATRCWVLAETLYLDGLDATLDDRPDDARPSLEKALQLYRALAPGAAFYGLDEAGDRMREVEAMLDGHPPNGRRHR